MGVFFTNEMKVLALLCLFVALSFAADGTKSNCTATAQTIVTTSCAAVDLQQWTSVSVNPAGSACTSTAYTADNIQTNGTFVLAVRPGDDASGNYTLATATAVVNNTAQACASIDGSAEDDDFDFTCSSSSAFSAYTTYYVNVVLAAAATANTTLEVYSGFAEGSLTDCAESYVSSSGSSIWLWVIIAVVVVLAIVIIVGAVGGFLYMKKKKSTYQLYEDA